MIKIFHVDNTAQRMNIHLDDYFQRLLNVPTDTV